MNTRLWHYLMNSILIVTTGSYRAMRIIANFTLDALNIPLNPFIIALHTNLAPYVTAYLSAYAAWLAQLGVQISSTNVFYLALESLRSTDSKLWDRMIQAVYPRGTVGYKKLMPHGKKDLQSGSQEDKVAAVEALSLNLVGEAGLVPVKTLVDAKLAILNSNKSSKNTGKSNTNIFSDAVENARVNLAQELYGVLGNLMYHFRANPSLIAPFFDITAIRNMEQTLWERALKSFQRVYLFERTFVAGDTIRLVNNSLFTIRFAMLHSKTDVIGMVYYDVPPMTGVTVSVTALGPLINHYMVVENLGAGQAKFVLVII